MFGPRPFAQGQFQLRFHRAWRRSDLRIALTMLFLIGTFGLNFTIFISTMAVRVFHVGAGGYGLLSSAIAAVERYRER